MPIIAQLLDSPSQPRRRRPALIALLVTLSFAAAAVAHTPLPDGYVPLLPDNSASAANIWGGNNDGQPVGSGETVPADHPGFDQAIRITVANPVGQFYNGAVMLQSTQAVADGDTLLARVYFRSIENTEETGAGFATAFVQGPSPSFNKYLTREINAFGEWKEFLFPFTVTDALPAGELSFQIGFGAGNRPQTFEVAGFELVNYQSSASVDELPATLPTYFGREPDAAWRTEAAARIEAHRKGDFCIRILDSLGQPVETNVQIEFQKHAYHFGSVIRARRIMGQGADDEQYRQTLLDYFNQSGAENDLKWAPWEGEWGSSYNHAQTLAALEWLRDQGLYLRGHVMVWPSKRNLPNLIQPYLPENDPTNADPAAKQIVLDHIEDIATATAPLLDEWDVLNEPYDNHYLMDAFGDQVMVDWFEEAREHLTTHPLYLNDYSILSAGGRDTAHQQHFEDTIRYLIDNDAPIDGIGLQGHFSASPTSIPRVFDVLQRYHAAFPDLAIRITEFDVKTTDESLQGDYTRDFLTIAFSHPATVGVQAWGFWAGDHYHPDAAMFDEDWREKPNAATWRELIFEIWWNDFQGETDASGAFDFRGFYGEYEATFSVGGQERSFTFAALADGPEEIVYDPTRSERPASLLRPATASEGTASVELQSRDASPHAVEVSSDLIDWEKFFGVDQPDPLLLYRKGHADNGSAFYRISED